MKPSLVPHSDYQAFVLQQLHKHAGPGIVLLSKDWPLAVKLWMTVLSAITTLLEPVYSHRGPGLRDPASLLRSYLLLLMTNPQMGITEWIHEMKRTPIYATLSGFPFDDLPGVGTFYDFFARLWPAASKHIKPKKQRRRKGKAKKGNQKGEKAPTSTPGRVERLVKWMMRHSDSKTVLPADKLFDFFQSQIVAVSAKLGLLEDLSALSAAGDGTPVATAAYPRSQPSCDCRARGLVACNHLHRLYSQPDCNTGWDSYREKFFNGYHLYMISAAASSHDLPLYPRLQPASRHDAVSLVVSAMEFKQRFTLR